MIEIFEVNIKETEPKLVDELFNIHEQVFLANDKLTYENFKNEFNIDNRLYFVAKIKQKVAGYIGIINCIDFFEIIGIGVKKQFQNKKIGTKLLLKIIEKARELKIKNIYLEVDEKNDLAINFYKKNGFVVTNRRKNYYKDSDALILNCSVL